MKNIMSIMIFHWKFIRIPQTFGTKFQMREIHVNNGKLSTKQMIEVSGISKHFRFNSIERDSITRNDLQLDDIKANSVVLSVSP